MYMRKITQEELNDILKTDGIKNLSYMDLRGLDLHDADLMNANIFRSALYEANLSGAMLAGAYIRGSDLSRANLEGAALNHASLIEVYAISANFKHADLLFSHISCSTASSSDFTGANLTGAVLSDVNMNGAIFCGANMNDISCHNLATTKSIIDETTKINVPMACPTTGSFIGWKKSRSGLIVKLEIPEDALRSSAMGRKCRVNKAKCLAIENVDGSDSGCKSTTSIYDRGFRYRIGQTITVPNFDTNRFNECAPGIHFFIDRQEAVDYTL